MQDVVYRFRYVARIVQFFDISSAIYFDLTFVIMLVLRWH